MKSIKHINNRFRFHGKVLRFLVTALIFLNAMLPVRSQVVIVRLIDKINDKAMYKGNDIHEAGFTMLKEDQNRILNLQKYISFYTTMMLNRESQKMSTLINIDDLFSDNKEWQEHFRMRYTTVRLNLENIEKLIMNYPRSNKLVIAHKRLAEDLEDADKKFRQAMDKSGQENMMRNDERNHLAILAENQLEQVAQFARDLFNVIPQTRKEIMKEGIGTTSGLPETGL